MLSAPWRLASIWNNGSGWASGRDSAYAEAGLRLRFTCVWFSSAAVFGARASVGTGAAAFRRSARMSWLPSRLASCQLYRFLIEWMSGNRPSVACEETLPDFCSGGALLLKSRRLLPEVFDSSAERGSLGSAARRTPMGGGCAPDSRGLAHLQLRALPGYPLARSPVVVRRCGRGGLRSKRCSFLNYGALPFRFSSSRSGNWPSLSCSLLRS